MTNKELSSNRTTIMGIAMIGIMLFHNDIITSIPYIGVIFKKTGYLGVDLFLFISGFGIAHSLNKNSINIFYFNRFIRIIPACLISGTIILLIDCYLHIEQSKAPTIFRLLSLQKWYIQAILIYYFLSPFIKRQINDYGIKFIYSLTVIALCLSIIVPNIGFIKLSWILNRLPIYCFGMYIGIYDFPTNSKKILLFQSLVLIISISILIISDTNKILGNVGLILWGLSIPLVANMLSKIFNKSQNSFFCKIISLFGVFSLEIYLTHEYVYWYSYTIENTLIQWLLTISLIIGSVCLLHYSSKTICKIVKKK